MEDDGGMDRAKYKKRQCMFRCVNSADTGL